MNLLAYFSNHFGSTNLVVNLLIALLVLVLIYYILSLFVPPRILQIVMAILALIVVLDLFVGCAGTNVSGTTPYGHFDYVGPSPTPTTSFTK